MASLRALVKIELLPQDNGSDLPDIPLAELTGSRVTLACDCYVKGIETVGTPVAWGWQYGASENIDHHAEVDAMARIVSSANLALLRVAARGHAADSDRVLITHNDCDSILSAGIVAGVLEADPRYGAAAIAADHTGEENSIADLLQSIQDNRNITDAFAALATFESGQPLPGWAAAMLDRRLRKREAAARAVAAGKFANLAGTYFADFDEETDGEFFPALLPEAELIVLGGPHPDPTKAGPRVVKVRRGLAMPTGRDLRHLGLKAFDKNYGGRWNAGSNKRGGGTGLSAAEWVAGLAAQGGVVAPTPHRD